MEKTMMKNKELTVEDILAELNITDEVIGVFPYGSRVYGTANSTSDSDFIIVTKGAFLPNGSFKNNAISNKDRTIQATLYSRSGFIDAINNYDIIAMECLSLPEDKVLLKKWPFKSSKWDVNEMVKKIIQKASASRHIADEQARTGFKERAKKGMFHALRILEFGVQLKEHGKIIDFGKCNELHYKFKSIEPDDFDTRDYYKLFDELIAKLRA